MDRYLKVYDLVPCGGEAFVLQTLFAEALRTIELPLRTYMYVHTVPMYAIDHGGRYTKSRLSTLIRQFPYQDAFLYPYHCGRVEQLLTSVILSVNPV